MRHLIPILLLLGCGEEFSNATFEEDGQFVAAAPSASRLRLAIGAQDGVVRQAQSTQVGMLYEFTRTTVLNLNRTGFDILRDVDRLVVDQPTERAPGFRAWATPAGGLQPYATRFEMRRADQAFDYVLRQDAMPTIQGNFDPIQRAGALTVDVAASARLQGTADTGKLHVDYAQDGRTVDLAMQFEGFREGGALRDSAYRFRRRADESGTIDFVHHAEDSVFEVRSRWLPTGAGRADARFTRGDQTVVIAECWGENFVPVYTVNMGEESGDITACAFPRASLPD